MTDLILDQGATWRRAWSLVNADGSPFDLTGAHARLTIRFGNAEGAVAFDLDDQTRGGITLGGASGAMSATVTAAASSALVLPTTNPGSAQEKQSDGKLRTAVGTYCVWAVEVTLPGGDVLRPEDGAGGMVITREIVR